MSRIAIVGITGTIGSRVAARLVPAGHDVVGLSRTGGEDALGVRRLAVDLTDRATAIRVLDGVDAIYLTPPNSGADPGALQRSVTMNVIDAARELGLGHVVMHTAVHADRGDTGARILDEKTPLEEALASSGLGYTILRPAWFLQNLHGARAWLEQGAFSMPWPRDMVWAATDIEDVARAAASFLESGPANRAFDVHVPGGITAGAICDAVERVTSHPVAYQEAPSTHAAVASYPISEAHKEQYAELFDYFKSTEYLGDPWPITKALPGFSYSGIEDFVARELFAPIDA